MISRGWWQLKGCVGTVLPRGRGAPGSDHQHGTTAAVGLLPQGPPPYLQAGEEPAILRQPAVPRSRRPAAPPPPPLPPPAPAAAVWPPLWPRHPRRSRGIPAATWGEWL